MTDVLLNGTEVKCPSHDEYLEYLGYETGGGHAVAFRCTRRVMAVEDMEESGGEPRRLMAHDLKLRFVIEGKQTRMQVESGGDDFEVPEQTQMYDMLTGEPIIPKGSEDDVDEMAEEMEQS